MKKNKSNSKVKGLAILLLCVLVYVVIANLPTPSGLSIEGQKSLALMLAAVIAWAIGVTPIAFTSVLLIMITGILGVLPLKDSMAHFATPTIFFIMSTFIIADVFIRTGLGRRISLVVSTIFGTKPSQVLLSYMIPTTVISAVLLDIPTAIIFGGIAINLLKANDCMPGKSNFGKQIMIGIPTAAALGGIGTPAGSGMNVLAIQLLDDIAGVKISFLQWTVIGFPMSIILTLIAWFIIRKMFPSEIEEVKGLDNIDEELKQLGKMTSDEKKFLVIFIAELILWLTSSLHGINTAIVGVVAAFLMFVPGIDLINWKQAEKAINWEMLLLVGAATSLSAAISINGAAEWLATTFLGGLAGQSEFILILAVSAFGVFIHYIIPVATAVLTVAIPVVSALALSIGINPGILALPIAFTASDVMIMPLDPIPLTTKHYGYWEMKDMMKSGFVISLFWIALCIAFMYLAQVLNII